MKTIFSWSLTLIYAVIAYLFVFGILSYKVHYEMPNDITYDISAFTELSVNPQYAYLVEERLLAFDIRLALINHAQESIDISYYAIHEGLSKEVFFGALLEAADRGVNIRFIIDGFIEGRGFNDAESMSVLSNHPNIDVAYYEVFSITAPFAVQNRLHDKLMIVDQTYGLIGGRNIGDRYYFDEDDIDKKTHDRDVLIFGEHAQAVEDMSDYFDYLFNHPYSDIIDNELPSHHTNRYITIYQDYISDRELELPTIMTDVYNDAFLVKNVTFMRSPLNRMHKEPVIFNALLELSRNYNDIIVQSPYVIFSRPMRQMLAEYDLDNITLLTNHPYTNPNILAVSGYLRIRQDLAESTTLYEYQKPLSLHTKTLIFGDEISVIGSINIDPRSAYLSTESVVVIYDEAFNTYMRSVIDTYLEDSLEVNGDLRYNEGTIEPIEYSQSRVILARIMKFLTYFFDEML